jgi:hypothetical protein
MKQYFATLAISLALALAGASAQPVFKCTAPNNIVFSDKGCAKELKGGPISVNTDEISPERKAEHDAIVSRDKALANQVEGARLSTERGQRAAQNAHLQADKALAQKNGQLLQQRNDATVSDPSVRQPKPFFFLP